MRYSRLKRALKKINQHDKIDVVHNFWFTKSALIASQFSLKNHVKHLVTFSGQEVLATNKLLSKLNLYKGLLFCLSEFHRERLKESTRVSARIIEPGIEDIEIKNIEKDIDLIFCGHISKLKNYERFIEIVAAVQKTAPLKKVVMCGGGDGLTSLKSKLQLLGLQNLVDIKGEIPRSEVIELMHRSKLLLHTSEFESFGLVLVEALACNCHVISTPVGIAWKHPKIISCITDEEFISKVKFCLSQENKMEVKAAKHLVSDMADKYLDVYKS
jgi:glycosyltransferase involved in cell wall biosynthesis